MKKKMLYTFIIIVMVFGGFYGYLEFTQRGQVIGMYMFMGFKAPLSVKIDCVAKTNDKVDQKFTLPLQINEESRNALKGYWHFSYYRACLFEEGYDTSGNIIHQSEIVTEGDTERYINYYGNFQFAVPNGTKIILDNETNPDIEDRRLTSTLTLKDATLNVLVYRDFDDATDFNTFRDEFEHFSTSTGNIVSESVVNGSNNMTLLKVEQDDGLKGYANYTPEGKVIMVFASTSQESVLQTIASTLKYVE